MQKVQKTYTQQFKRETLQITRTCEKPITQGARELGIHNCSIHQWRKTWLSTDIALFLTATNTNGLENAVQQPNSNADELQR